MSVRWHKHGYDLTYCCNVWNVPCRKINILQLNSPKLTSIHTRSTQLTSTLCNSSQLILLPHNSTQLHPTSINSTQPNSFQLKSSQTWRIVCLFHVSISRHHRNLGLNPMLPKNNYLRSKILRISHLQHIMKDFLSHDANAFSIDLHWFRVENREAGHHRRDYFEHFAMNVSMCTYCDKTTLTCYILSGKAK